MNKQELLKDLRTRMDGAMKVLDHEFKGLRTGRASVNLLDPVTVEAYGSRMPIAQLSTLSTPDAKTIIVQVWDKGMIKTVEKAIVEANLGVMPHTDGQNIRITLPPLSEERRKELAKLAHKYAESARISIRNVRHQGIETIKSLEKSSEISEDDLHSFKDDIQKVTDEFIGKIDLLLKNKEKEIMTI